MLFHFVTVLSWIEVIVGLLALLVVLFKRDIPEKKWWQGVIEIINSVTFPLALAWLITIHYWS